MQHFSSFLKYLLTGFLITSKNAKATLKGNKTKLNINFKTDKIDTIKKQNFYLKTG